jgi:hypothetical protein
MPLLSVLIANIAMGFAALFSRFFVMRTALKFAAYSTWITVTGAFLATVYVCTISLYSGAVAMMSASGGVNSGFMSALMMGFGMFIPANAGAVLACVSSVWIATTIYKTQSWGITHFGS